MISPMVVVLDEALDLGFKIARKKVVLQRGGGSSTSGASARSCLGSEDGRARRGCDRCRDPEPLGEVASDVTRPIVGKQSRPLSHGRLIAAGSLKPGSASVTSSAFMVVHSFQAMM